MISPRSSFSVASHAISLASFKADTLATEIQLHVMASTYLLEQVNSDKLLLTLSLIDQVL